MDRVNQIFTKMGRAVALLMLMFIVAFAASTAQALPRPTAASYARGAQFEVAGYDAAKSALADFPVLVRIANDSPSGFAYSQLQSSSDGADLCFIDMNGNGLPFEIDTWDPDGTSLVWVNLPTMAQGTHFVMCWGSATSGKTVCGDNPFAGYKGVWHMNSTSPADSSGSGNDGTGACSVAVVAGVVGSGLSYPDKSSYVSCGSSQAEAELTANGYTVEGWVNLAGLSGNQALFGKSGFISYRMEGTAVKITTPAVADYSSVGNFITAANEWHYFALSFIPNTTGGAKHYMDGVLKTEQNTGAINNKTGSIEMWLARNQWGNDQGLVGLIDEYRLSPTVRSADWIAASRATQIDSAFLTAGEAQEYEASAAPDLGLVALPSTVHYTNATLTATIGSLGKNEQMTVDAEWVDPLLVVSTNADLSDPLFVLPLSRVSATPASIPVTLVPLATNTTYYAQIQATNSFDVAGESGVVSFTTRAPGAPSGTAIFMDRGFSTMAATATVSDFGVGAVSATARLEASTDGFATVVAGSDVAAILDTQVPLSVPGLAPDTEYALRIRIRNDWGIDTFVALPATHTRDVPFATTGIGWQFSQDGSMIDISFGVSGIYDGATGTATLTYNGVGRGTEGIAAAGTLSWPGIAAADGTVAATVVVTATLEGQTYTKTFAVNVASGSTAVAVTDVTAHTSAATAIRIHAGDVVTLPELSGSEQYIVGNKLFASLDGNVLTALRPGIVGVHCIGNDYTTNTLAVLVLPEKIGNGGIYIFKESSISGNNNGLWCSAESWEKVGAETNDSYPQNPDDIAIIPYYSLDSRSINLGGDVAVGELYVGGYCDNKAYVTLGTNNSSYKRKLSLCREDGKMAIVQLCSSSLDLGNNAYRATLKFSDGLALVEFLSDTTLSGGWDGTDSNHPQGRFDFSAKTNSISDNVTVMLREMDTQGVSYNAGTIAIGNLSGSGTFWNHSRGLVRYGSGSSSFIGRIRDSGGHGAGGESQGRSGPAYFRSTSITNASAEVVGWVASDGQDPQSDYRKGVGALYTGYPHFHEVDKPHNSYFPARGATMHGGLIVNRYIGSGAWTNTMENSITRDTKRTDFLNVDCGFNYLFGDGTSDSNPGNDFIADAVFHGNKATLRITDPSRYSLASAATSTNVMNILHGIAAHAIGAGGDCETTMAYSIVPWVVAPVANNDQNTVLFACFDGTYRLVRPSYESRAIDSFGNADNAVVWTSGQNSIALSADKTLNSLVLDNSGTSSSDRRLGAGKTLTITSGGLSFSKSAANIGQENGGDENGFLVLGDATHPAYVWARGSTSSPNQVWAKVTAPGGFVSAYTGNLVLGGDQRGIGDEIVVNAGTLILGTANTACQLTKDIPIRIFANATLQLPNAESSRGAIVKFDGAAGWFGKVEVPEGIAAKCWKAYWRDYPETQEWQNLKRGVYTGDEATALANPKVVYDPEHFSGAGTLEVLRDDLAMPLVIRLK